MKLETLLAVLQQAEYDLPEFEHWVKVHKENNLKAEVEKWTLKLKLIRLGSRVLFF